MDTTMYNQLDQEQKILVSSKIALRICASQKEVCNILTEINPPIKIVEEEIILFYHTLIMVQEKINFG